MIGEPWPSALGSWIRAYAVAPTLRKLPFQRSRRRRGSAEPSSSRSWAQGLAPEFSRTVARHITRPLAPRTEKEHHLRLMTRPMLGQSLSLIEAVGAGAGVEVRFPFFDVRLVELCISLPAEQKLRRGWSRFAMRQAMVGFLPEEIRWRRGKSSVEPGFHHALRSRSGEHIHRVLSSADERLARYLDPAYCAELHRRFMTCAASPEESVRSWRITSLALWLMGSDRAHTTHEARDWPYFAAVAPCGPRPQEV
jgi:asparagine synthetase B (glutamine-hydrolysing)